VVSLPPWEEAPSPSQGCVGAQGWWCAHLRALTRWYAPPDLLASADEQQVDCWLL
jgi:hypothetical protein